MKIKIELTKSEVAAIKKTSKKVSYSYVDLLNTEIEDENVRYHYCDFFNDRKFDHIINTEQHKNKIGTYESTVQDNGNVVMDITLKAVFIKELLNLGGIFCEGVARFAASMVKPVQRFFEKFM